MRSNRLTVALAGALLATTMGVSAVQAGGPQVVMVDGDGRALPGDCNAGASGSASEKIQDGVDAVAPGGTVWVCPGTYVEQVEVIGKDGVTVRSTRPWKAVIQAPNELESPFIVSLAGGDGVTFQGFKVETRVTPDCDSPEIAVIALGGRGFVIRGNRVVNHGDTFGPCAFVAGIVVGYPFGSAAAAGIGPRMAGLTEDFTTTALVAYNSVWDHIFFGIAAFSAVFDVAGAEVGATRATITHNSVRYFHSDYHDGDTCTTSAGGRVAREARRTLAALTPAGPGLCEGIGIYLGAGTNDSPIPGAGGVISANRVLSGPHATQILTAGEDPVTPRQTVGILVVDPRHAAGATKVTGNQVFRNVFGVLAADAGGVTIKGNRAFDNYVGIAVGDTEGASVRDNDVRGNLLGIIADDEPIFSGDPQPYYVTDDVVFRDNDARNNPEYSCEDQTLGDGTQGTDNTWTDNTAALDSSSPLGICGGVSP